MIYRFIFSQTSKPRPGVCPAIRKVSKDFCARAFVVSDCKGKDSDCPKGIPLQRVQRVFFYISHYSVTEINPFHDGSIAENTMEQVNWYFSSSVVSLWKGLTFITYRGRNYRKESKSRYCTAKLNEIHRKQDFPQKNGSCVIISLFCLDYFEVTYIIYVIPVFNTHTMYHTASFSFYVYFLNKVNSKDHIKQHKLFLLRKGLVRDSSVV